MSGMETPSCISGWLHLPGHPVLELAMMRTMSKEEFLKGDEVVSSLISIVCLEK